MQSQPNRIHQLTLTRFRNHGHIVLESAGSSMVLHGANGLGKTNVLEAISLLSPGAGLRKARFSAMSQEGAEQGWVLSAHVMNLASEMRQIGMGLESLESSEKRQLRMDGEPLKSQSALASELAISWHIPAMDSLFADSPSLQRRFLDRLAYQFDADHARRVSHYEHVMRERNRLLQRPPFDTIWLGVYEQQMTEQAVAIAAARLELIERLNEACRHLPTAFPKALMSLTGEVEAQLQQGLPAAEIEHYWQAILSQSRSRDAAAGRLTAGLHRCQWHVMHETKAMPAASCSTGEQKALLLSILLAHAMARKAWLGAPPILLLDEVVAHLDVSRRQLLADLLASLGAQCWLTGTDAADFQAFAGWAQLTDIQALVHSAAPHSKICG